MCRYKKIRLVCREARGVALRDDIRNENISNTRAATNAVVNTGIASSVAGAALGGAKLGAVVGTAFPGVGNVVGLVVGTAIGALAGTAAHMLINNSNLRERAQEGLYSVVNEVQNAWSNRPSWLGGSS